MRNILTLRKTDYKRGTAILRNGSHSFRGRDAARCHRLRLTIRTGESTRIYQIRSYRIDSHLISERIIHDIEIINV